MTPTTRPLTQLQPGDPFPPVDWAWGENDPVSGLLAVGGTLDTDSLLRAYRQGIFPWFGPDQPILWWSPDPRMLLPTSGFHLPHGLRKALRTLLRQGRLDIRIDTAFDTVIRACADTPRPGQDGTWIVPAMQAAYRELHRAGHAHSIETWWDGELVGGLYAVGIGHMVFGESMFSHRSQASKMALAALVAWCQKHQLPWIDCQQHTDHLASLGARLLPRQTLSQQLPHLTRAPSPDWTFTSADWQYLPGLLTPLTGIADTEVCPKTVSEPRP